MNHSPFFSIVTPVFNGSAFISSYVSSLITQTFEDWEAVIVDDGSLDGSLDYLRSLVLEDQRFRLIMSDVSSQPRKVRGPYLPRNLALSLVKGNYVCFYDIDDYWFDHKLQRQFDAIQSNPNAKLIYSDYFKANSSLSKGYLKPRIDVLPIKYQVYLWNPIPNLTSCVEATLATSLQFEPIHHEDYVFWFRILSSLNKYQIVKVNVPLALYRSAPDSLSSNKFVVLSWWLLCFKLIGHQHFISFLLLFVRICAEFIELFLVQVKFIATIDLSSFVIDSNHSDA